MVAKCFYLVQEQNLKFCTGNIDNLKLYWWFGYRVGLRNILSPPCPEIYRVGSRDTPSCPPLLPPLPSPTLSHLGCTGLLVGEEIRQGLQIYQILNRYSFASGSGETKEHWMPGEMVYAPGLSGTLSSECQKDVALLAKMVSLDILIWAC